MVRRIAHIITVATVLSPVLIQAQTPNAATDIPWSEIEAVLNSPEGGVDRQVKVTDIGPINVAVGILHRDALEGNGGPPRGIAHTEVTEVYYIVSGSGTLVTGGQIVDRSEITEGPIVEVIVGPSVTGTSEGGQVRVVSEGDVVVIPAGVFHGWTEIPDHVTYLSVRPDPYKVLPAGYVNPVIP